MDNIVACCPICWTVNENPDYVFLKNMPNKTFASNGHVTMCLCQCEKCGAVFTPTDKKNSECFDVHRNFNQSKLYCEKKKCEYSEFVDKYKPNKIIEVGCGNGQIMKMFKEFGKDIYGCETNLENYIECIKNGLSVFHGNLFYITNNYDAFICSYLLEHLPSPNIFCYKLYLMLNDNGVGLIEVPNYDYIEKHRIWEEITPDHIVYYRANTIKRLLLSHGFEILNVYDNDLCLRVEVRKRTFNRVSWIKNARQKKINDIFNTVKNLKRPIAVYGAGHYSQSVLCSLNAEHGWRPDYIFDKSPLRIGQDICGITVDGVGEMESKHNMYDTIIICCGMYTDEVYAEFKQNDIFKTKDIILWN